MNFGVNKMMKMTEKELLAMTLEDCPLDITFDVALNEILIGHDDLKMPIALDLECNDIELIPESPAITFKNLGRFMAKYGGFPGAVGHSRENGTIDGWLTSITVDGGTGKVDNETFIINDITITDERWAKMGVEDE